MTIRDTIGSAVGEVRRTRETLAEPVRRGESTSPSVVAAAVALLLGLIPLGIGVVRFLGYVWDQDTDNPLEGLAIGLLLIPFSLAVLAALVVGAVLVVGTAATVLMGRQHAPRRMHSLGATGVGIAIFFAIVGLIPEAIALGVTACIAVLLAGRPQRGVDESA